MSLADLRDDIMILSDSQVARINKNDKRVICDKEEHRLTSQAVMQADSVHGDIEALNVDDFDTLNSMLPAARKLNGRPC